MENKKTIFEGASIPLPDTTYVSLTEAITWIAYNDARDDKFFADYMNREAAKNFEAWRDVEGPEWLLPHLELLEDGMTWEDVPDRAGNDLARLIRQQNSIEGWLEKTGRDLKKTIEEVVALLETQYQEAEPFHQAMALIWQACAAEDVTLQGLQFDHKNDVTAGQHFSVPFRYFLRPVEYFWGNGPNRMKGLLCPRPPETEDELFKQLSSRPDDRPDFVEILIRRDHVMMLEKRFRDQTTNANRPRAGRPPAYDWPRFQDEAVRILEEEGEPGLDPDWGSLADLERRMTDWCESAWGRVPAESTIRKRSRDALAAFRRNRKAEN